MNLAATIVLLWAVPLTSHSGATRPTRIVGPSFAGAIVSAEEQLNSDPRHVLKLAEVWTPTEADVLEAEKLLPPYLDSLDATSVRASRIRAQLPRYKRQYWGVIRRGRREILIHFYHEDTPVGRNRLWLQSILAVLGGGDQFLRVS